MTEEIIRVMQDAGQIILHAHDIGNDIESKPGSANFVTKYDKEVQAYLFNKLSEIVPDAEFIGEEDEKQKTSFGEKCFIIDPIDGTTNFIFDYRHSAISVAFLLNGEVTFGVVYNPYQNELFFAIKGEGAFLRSFNGDGTEAVPKDQLLRMKNIPLSEGIACFGTAPYNRELKEIAFELAEKLYDKALDIRRSGSAALDLCYVAAGRYAAFTEPILSPWDFAAGTIIVQEAGGIITTLDRKTMNFHEKCSAIAGTPKAYEDFFN